MTDHLISEADRADISRRILEGMGQRPCRMSVQDETHRLHHEFIEKWIIREQRRQELREHARKQAVGWGVVAMLSAAGLGAYNWLEAIIKRISSGGA